MAQTLLDPYINKKDIKYEDPREAILKYAEVDADPYFFRAYKETQPVTIFDNKEVPQDLVAKPAAKKAKK